MSEVLKPGQTFAGRYRIEKFLAKGGFGAVYIAEQTETELRVALKVLWPHVLFSEDAVEKFKLEARVAGRVGSDYIVRVFDAGFDDATRMPFLVMELLDGEELQRKVEREGALPAELVLSYFRQISSALDKAHGYVDRHGAKRPIVHRDLKPENLFLARRESGDAVVKILDFGIAKILSDSTKVSTEMKGTPLYMAFEQASAGQITPQTDIWALGLIAFYLLTGHCYWKAASMPEASLTQLFGEVLSLPIDPPSDRARSLGASVIPPASFDAWFARCVNRDPAARFKTAGECSVALAAAVSGVGLPAGIRSEPGVAQPAPSAPVAALSGTNVAPTERSAETPRRDASTAGSIALGRTKEPEVSGRGSVFAALSAAVLVVGGGLTVLAMRGGPSPDPSGAGSVEPGGQPPPTSLPSVQIEKASSADPVASTTPAPSAERPAATTPARSSSPPPTTTRPVIPRPLPPKPSATGSRPPEPTPTPVPTVKKNKGIYDDR